MKRLLKNFVLTLHHAELLIELQFYVISCRATLKGIFFNLISRNNFYIDGNYFGNSFAYVEFADKLSVDNALKLDDTPFKGRQLKVI